MHHLPAPALRDKHKKDKSHMHMHMHISAPTAGLRGKHRAKTSKKKHHSSSPVTSVGSSGSNMVPSLGDATELIGSDQPTLSEKLKVFKASGFDPEGFLTTKCRNMSQKVGYDFTY